MIAMSLEDVGLILKTRKGNYYFPEFVDFYETLEFHPKEGKEDDITELFINYRGKKVKLMEVDIPDIGVEAIFFEIIEEMALKKLIKGDLIFAAGKIILVISNKEIYKVFAGFSIPIESLF